MAIQVLLASDSEVIRNGLRSLLTSQKDIHVVGDAINIGEFRDKVESLQPDITVLVLDMDPLRGIQVIDKIRLLSIKTQIIVASLFSEPEYIHHFLKSGAAGYLLAESLGAEILEAIRLVHGGNNYVSRKVADSYQAGEGYRFGTIPFLQERIPGENS
jgi:DNA-binding NarL/FixJ family response regulator